MSIIGFLSDLGIYDDAVGLCKGLMLKICPTAQIVDITHYVPPFNIEEGSLYLKDIAYYFPEQTTIACVVYPQTGTKLNCLAVRNSKGHVFVAPNNGLLTQVFAVSEVCDAYEITSANVMQPELSPTFYGRDIIVSAAAYIAGGYPIDQLGRKLNSDEIRILDFPLPENGENGDVFGIVSLIDKNFGNVWTNIPAQFLKSWNSSIGQTVIITFNDDFSLKGTLQETFGGVDDLGVLVYTNSRGYIGIALNKGNLASKYNINRGINIKLSLIK